MEPIPSKVLVACHQIMFVNEALRGGTVSDQPLEKPVVGEAEYVMESPIKCPYCRETISSLLIVRLLRGRVNFISTLPRRGYIMVCPACHCYMGGDLGGLT
jgi:hypothetical protein